MRSLPISYIDDDDDIHAHTNTQTRIGRVSSRKIKQLRSVCDRPDTMGRCGAAITLVSEQIRK